MVALHETAYPRFKYNATKPEIKPLYTPSEAEHRWVRGRRVNSKLQQVYFVYLKSFQRLGYFPRFADIPLSIKEYIAQSIGRSVITDKYVEAIPNTTSRRIKSAVRRHCHVKRFTLQNNGKWLRDFAYDIAKTKESVVDIINAMIEILAKESYELPAFSMLDRMGYESRSAVNSMYYLRIADSLSKTAIDVIESILTKQDTSGETLWHKLKTEPKRPSIKSFKQFYEHSKWIREIADTVGALPELPEAKRYQLIMEGKAYTRDKISEIEPQKKIALSALLINEQAAFCTDCLVDLFIREIRRLHNKARIDLKDFQLTSVNESEKLVSILRDVAVIMSEKESRGHQLNKIKVAFDNDPKKVATRCNRLVRHGMKSHLQFLKSRYTKPVQKTLLNCLAFLEIDHTAHGGDLLSCLNAIMEYREAKLSTIAVNAIDVSTTGHDTAINWIGKFWSSVLYTDLKPNKANRLMDMMYFEICVLSEISKRFQSGDLFVNNSTKYDDYRKHLITWDQYNQKVQEFALQIGLSRSPDIFTKKLKNDFKKVAKATDRRFPKDSFVELTSEHVHLKRRKAAEPTEAMQKFDAAIRDAMPSINIVDLLVAATQWVELHKSFKPVSGHKTKMGDYTKRLVVSLFCYGCNLGPVQTARSIKGLSRKQIAYLNLAHTREKDLIEATRLVVNAYNKFELPSYWGTGSTASVDGTRFDMYEQSLLSEFHVRYAAFGGIGYYMVSDTYIALFSRFIPCGVREAMYLIDALMQNQSEINPDTVHGDTHAQSTIVFGLCHLLGIKLMPRIKDINKLIFFKPDGRIKYEHIDSLFSESINYKIIKSNYADMLRVAMSIKEGKVTASTVVRRLGERGIRNSLYYSFRELGRVVRTQYLLDYITDIKMRETVQAATCKSEAFNDFVKWVFFFNNGEIQENLRHEQSKMVNYNHLVANLVILHNVNSMTKVIKQMSKEGFEITEEMLASLAPYRREHIDLLGKYPLQVNKRRAKQSFKLF